MKYLNIFFRGANANWQKLLEYKEEFYTELVSNSLEILLVLFFWSIIFSMVTNVNGWTIGTILLINAFMFMFHGFLDTIYEGVWAIENIITYGKIDRYLPRPVEPIFVEMSTHLGMFGIKEFINAAICFSISAYLGTHIGFGILFGILLCFLGATIFALIGLCIQFLSFWIGRSNAIYGLFSIVWHFADYPMTMFPILMQMAFLLIIPIFIVGSVPAMTVAGMLSIGEVIKYLIIEIALVAFWGTVAVVMWKEGLKRYDSYGG